MTSTDQDIAGGRRPGEVCRQTTPITVVSLLRLNASARSPGLVGGIWPRSRLDRPSRPTRCRRADRHSPDPRRCRRRRRPGRAGGSGSPHRIEPPAIFQWCLARNSASAVAGGYARRRDLLTFLQTRTAVGDGESHFHARSNTTGERVAKRADRLHNRLHPGGQRRRPCAGSDGTSARVCGVRRRRRPATSRGNAL